MLQNNTIVYDAEVQRLKEMIVNHVLDHEPIALSLQCESFMIGEALLYEFNKAFRCESSHCLKNGYTNHLFFDEQGWLQISMTIYKDDEAQGYGVHVAYFQTSPE